MEVDVHEAVEHGLHEFVVKGLEVVVGEFDPLEAVEVLKRWRQYLPDAVQVTGIKVVQETVIVIKGRPTHKLFCSHKNLMCSPKPSKASSSSRVICVTKVGGNMLGSS